MIDQVTPVSFKVANLQGKLQKGSIHVNRIKQYFTYDDPPIDPLPQNNSAGNSPNPTPKPQNLFAELPGTEDTELVHDILSNTSRNVATDHVEGLEEINPLPDLTESQQQQQKIKDIHNADNQPDINTIPKCTTNHGKRRATHSVEKETPANDHTLSDRVINCGSLLVQGKQTILLTILINRKQEMKIFQLTLVKPLPTTVTYTSWNR